MDYYGVSMEYDKLQNGAGKLAAIKKAIEAADAEKDYDCAARFRYDYMNEVVFYDDIFKAFVMLPEYLKVFDEHCNEIHYRDKYIDIFYSYVWVIDNSEYFYQISKEKMTEYLEDFKRRSIECGYSLRAYYISLARCMEDIDEDKYIRAFNKYLSAKKDEINNCEKCETFNKIKFEMFHGSYEKAMKLAKPILDNKINCGNNLECLYNNILYYHLNHNIVKENIEELSKYKSLLYRKMSKSLSSLEFVATIIQYCVIVNLGEALSLFKKHLDWNLKTKTPKDKFNFELAAYRLFRAIKEKQNKKTIKLNLNSNFALYNEGGIYLIDELINYFKNDIMYIAKKFDERNGNNNCIKDVMNESFLN